MLVSTGCVSPANGPADAAYASDRSLRYVALGDSYTIGTSVTEAERWPNQLVARIGPEPPRLQLIANLAVDGYTSADVVADQVPALGELEPQFASVLVGVNDVVQRVPEEVYARNLAAIFDRLLAIVPPRRIVAISTPDYTVTPHGADFGDPARQSAAIRRYNEILRTAAEERDIPFVDIYDLSLLAADDPTLTARDGLHPSGAQYALWADRIVPVVEQMLRQG